MVGSYSVRRRQEAKSADKIKQPEQLLAPADDE